jgi:hypothetical protein
MVLVDGAGLSQGGTLWFPDLTAPDPYLILPMLSGASLFGMASLGDAGQQARAQLMRSGGAGPALTRRNPPPGAPCPHAGRRQTPPLPPLPLALEGRAKFQCYAPCAATLLPTHTRSLPQGVARPPLHPVLHTFFSAYPISPAAHPLSQPGPAITTRTQHLAPTPTHPDARAHRWIRLSK